MVADQKPKQKSKLKMADKEQSERFKETARKLGVEENTSFGEILKKIAPNRRAQKSD